MAISGLDIFSEHVMYSAIGLCRECVLFFTFFSYLCRCFFGKVPEWPIGAVSKTVVPSGTQGSNPCLSAKQSDIQPKKFRSVLVSVRACGRCGVRFGRLISI